MLWPAGPGEAELGTSVYPCQPLAPPLAVHVLISGPRAAGSEEVNGRAQIWVKLVSRARSQRHVLGCTLPPTVSCKNASALSMKPTGLAGLREQNCNPSQPGRPIAKAKGGLLPGRAAPMADSAGLVSAQTPSSDPSQDFSANPSLLPTWRVPKGCGPWQGEKRAIP